MEQAIGAASVAQKKLSQLCLDGRGTIIRAMRDVIEEHAEELAKLAVEETGLGRLSTRSKRISWPPEKHLA